MSWLNSSTRRNVAGSGDVQRIEARNSGARGAGGVNAKRPTGTASAEARRRLALSVGIATVLAVSVLPLTGGVGALATPLVERCQELLAHCALALRAAGGSVRWMPWALLAAGVLYAAIDRLRLARRVSRVIAAQPQRPPHGGDRLQQLASYYGVETRVVVLTGQAPNPAFTAGIVLPVIYVAEALQTLLTEPELRATFRHELHHLRRWDPLRFAALRFAAKVLFWLPLVRVLAEEMMEEAEMLADDFAAQPDGGADPLDVASALLKIGRGRTPAVTGSEQVAVGTIATTAGTAGIGGMRVLTRRVRRLGGEEAVLPPVLPMRPTAFSTTVLLALWGSTALLPARGDAAHTLRVEELCPHMSSPVTQAIAGHVDAAPRADRDAPSGHAARVVARGPGHGGGEEHETHCPRCDDAKPGRAFPCRSSHGASLALHRW